MTKTSFTDYQLSDDIQRALAILKYDTPTEVQQKVIPLALENLDLVVKSQTGSGKTAAFGIPVTDQLEWEEKSHKF